MILHRAVRLTDLQVKNLDTYTAKKTSFTEGINNTINCLFHRLLILLENYYNY